MKNNLLHICFVLDESGSMYPSKKDVIGGFRKLVDEQKQVDSGECIISLYRFSDKVQCNYIGKSVKDIPSLEYNPGGLTAMNDGIGTAIDKIGKWLNDMEESQRPSKNMIVVMTDGSENSSKEYSTERVKEMIKHQEEKYNWSFVYMGTDIATLDDAKDLGITMLSVSSRDNIAENYENISCYANCYRSVMDVTEADIVSRSTLNSKLESDTKAYELQNGITL